MIGDPDKQRVITLNDKVVVVELDDWEKAVTAAAARYARCERVVIGQLVHGVDGLFELLEDRFHEPAIREIEKSGAWKPIPKDWLPAPKG